MDKQTFREFLSDMAPAVLRWVKQSRWFTNPEDAQEVAQDALLNALDAPRTAMRDPSAWLYRVTRNTQCAFLRRARAQSRDDRLRVPLRDDLVAKRQPEDADNINTGYFWAMKRLSPEHRDALTLEAPAFAERHNVTCNTAHQRKKRAKPLFEPQFLKWQTLADSLRETLVRAHRTALFIHWGFPRIEVARLMCIALADIDDLLALAAKELWLPFDLPASGEA